MITLDNMVSVSDSELVSGSLSGNRDAFGQIVSRYQSLICSLAYSATGSLNQSEDLAQETFVTAWKNLRGLREPEKLRSWLCGIARNVINSSIRKHERDPNHRAESIEEISDSMSPDLLPDAETIGKEEQAILWRSIGRIPETYREPLVLFYREHKSIEAVAQHLELTEDAVKQRLSRGRKLLHDEVLSFVEGALERTNPGKAFTIAVIAALPAFSLSANAAVVGAAAAKGGTAAKAGGILGTMGALLGIPIAIYGNYLSYRSSLDSAESDEERAMVKSFYAKILWAVVFFLVGIGLLMVFQKDLTRSRPAFFATLAIGLSIGYGIVIAVIMFWSMRRRRQMAKAAKNISMVAAPAFEYRSATEVLGLPLVHIRIGGSSRARSKVVKAWIAVGEVAFGGLFAFGGFAVAPISVGGLGLGLFAWGGCTVGVAAMGGLSVGIWALGGAAIGWQAFGGAAVAWKAAVGGVSVAHDFALGGIALAAQANNEVAGKFVKSVWFFRSGDSLLRNMFWINLFWVVPMFFWWKVAKRAKPQVG